MKTKLKDRNKKKEKKDSYLIKRIYKTYKDSWNKLETVRRTGYEEVMERS